MIKISVRGIDEVRRFLAEMQRDVKTIAEGAVAEYLVGDQTHGLKHYVPYQYVTMEQAGGWKSEKQRRFVMASIREGTIDPGYPHRTGELQRGWEAVQSGKFWRIVNETEYAHWVMGEQDQSRMHSLIGWRTTGEVIKTNLKGAFRHALAKLKEYFKRKKR